MWAAGVFQAAPTGVLIIENVPANAVVTVDDESVTFLRSGEQVTVEALNRGNHRIKVVSNGVELLSRDVTVKVDAEPTRVRAKNLNPKKAKSNDKPKR
jgi:archaellum component FlaG (FlaF/FlaG flagellin family)